MLYACIPGAAECDIDVCKNVLRSILRLRATSGGQLNANRLLVIYIAKFLAIEHTRKLASLVIIISGLTSFSKVSKCFFVYLFRAF